MGEKLAADFIVLWQFRSRVDLAYATIRSLAACMGMLNQRSSLRIGEGGGEA
jgi:hypothetical protein